MPTLCEELIKLKTRDMRTMMSFMKASVVWSNTNHNNTNYNTYNSNSSSSTTTTTTTTTNDNDNNHNKMTFMNALIACTGIVIGF